MAKRTVLYSSFIGFLSGSLLAFVFFAFGSYLQDTFVLRFLCFIAEPMAKIISALSGWPLQQESAIMVYVLAIPSTLILLSTLIGLVIGFIKKRRMKPRQERF